MELSDFFSANPRVAVAFSGGVDSSYLLYEANSLGVDVVAYYVKSAFQPDFELSDAVSLCEKLSVPLRILPLDVLSDPEILAGGADRCYHCKKRIFTLIAKTAASDGYSVLLDGTNASDDTADRPGMRALSELLVRSPLRECGLTKPEIRRRAKEAGLEFWDKPAYACLATRIPTGEAISAEKLAATDKAESLLREMGFRDFRIRYFNGAARLQLRAEDFPLLIARRSEVLRELSQYYPAVLLDLAARSGE